MKRNYYYLIAGLQDIAIDTHKLSMGQIEFKQELAQELHPQDFLWIKKLFLPYDHTNLLNLLFKKEQLTWDKRGNYSKEIFEENIKEPTGDLPHYMNRFIEAHKNNEFIFPKISPENQLTTLFYEYILSSDNEFLRKWFRFNRDLNNILTAMICRKYDIPYENQIIGFDDISETIKKSHARDFGLTSEIDYMDDLINISKLENTQEREKSIDRLRWSFLDEHTFFEYFTVDKVMAFIIKLGMVERWLSIDSELGAKMFNELLNELKSSYKLPETFTE
ncbi:MAG: DUF2764 family protein, partial [Bacteroidota bacterium]